MMSDSINELPFKLRFTSTQKLTKEMQTMVEERNEMYDKLSDEYETIGQHKDILGRIRDELSNCHESLKSLRALCQCQSDDEKNVVNKQLTTSEEILAKLNTKCNTIQTVKMVDIGVKRLPSNWRAAMLKIAKDKAKKAFNDSVSTLTADGSQEVKDSFNDNNQNNGNNNNRTEDNNDSKPVETNEEVVDENLISASAAEMNHQFEMDLERKIYETQIEEILHLIQSFVMRIKTLRARIDISKQLIKVVLKMKREYESSNSKLKETMATCHCAEAGADDDLEFQKRMQEKRSLEETIERISNNLKDLEEMYAILKEGRNKSTDNDVKMETNVNTPTTTVVEVVNEEVVANEYAPIASTSSQQSCMFAGQTQHSLQQQGTANPAVIYLEGLVAHQQPTYIPAANLHQPIGVYPHTYPLGHHPYHQAPDGSIQVYSSDIASHPGYIAYQ